MKHLSLSSSPVILVMGILILGLLLPSYNSYAAKKRKVDALKYPELNQFVLPEIQAAETANGIKLRLIKYDKLPLVNLYILLRGGNVYESITKIGLAEIVSDILRIGGTKELSGDQLDKLLDANGISISTSTFNDYFKVSLSCLTDNFDQAVSILAKIIKEPAFDQEKLEEIKTKAATSISRRNENPDSINTREFEKLIYGADSPLAAVLEYEHLENISRADVVQMYQQFFAADNMLVGVSGPFEIKEVQQLFDKYFGDWNTRAKIPPFPGVTPQKYDFKVAFAEKSSLNQSYLSVGHLGVKENMTEKAKIKVFNSIFSKGFTSRLMYRVRVKMGLTYGIYGGIDTEYLYPGQTSFSTYTKSESTVKAIKAIFDEIQRIRQEKVSEKELKDAKNYFLNSYVFDFSSPKEILLDSLERELYGVDEEAQKRLIEDIKKVTADDVLRVAQQYLHPDKMVIFVVGNGEKIKQGGNLSELGKVKKIDISIKPPPMKEKIPPATPETLEKGKKIIEAMEKKNYKIYMRIKSLIMESSSQVNISGRTIAFESKSTVLFPNKSYTETLVMGTKFERIINGKKGVTRQMGQERPVSEEDIEERKFGDFYNILNTKEDYNFQYLREEEIEGKRYHVIYISDAKMNWMKWYINQETQLREIGEQVSKIPGQTGIARTVLSDYKMIKGIPFAFKRVTFVKGQKVSDVTIKEIKVNPKVDLSIFELK
jgi:zinc protease